MLLHIRRRRLPRMLTVRYVRSNTRHQVWACVCRSHPQTVAILSAPTTNIKPRPPGDRRVSTIRVDLIGGISQRTRPTRPDPTRPGTVMAHAASGVGAAVGIPHAADVRSR